MKNSFLFLLTTILLVKCTKPCSEDFYDLGGANFSIELFDIAKNDYFYNENPNKCLYIKDSLKIFDDKGYQFKYIEFATKSDPRQPVNIINYINFGPAFYIPTDNDAFNAEKSKKIYLKYNQSTSDTLEFVFKAGYNECHKSIWEYYKVYHRGKIIATTSGASYVKIILNH